MKNRASKQHSSPSNYPTDGDVFKMMLEAMTVEELIDGLNAVLESMTEENYDPALIDTYLAVLDQKDPMPQIPDAKSAFSDFQKKVSRVFPVYRNRSNVFSRRFQHMGRSGLAAALAVVLIMSSMVIAQAAGLDVFGAMARWTDKVFSLGAIQSKGADDEIVNTTNAIDSDNVCCETDYKTLQEALDNCGITEFAEPSWIPDGYELESIKIDCWPNDGVLIGIFATYSDGSTPLYVTIEHSPDEPHEQMEKTDTPVETFVAGGFTVYLLENINNNFAAWATEHYECYISGSVTKHELKQIVLSAYAHIQ